MVDEEWAERVTFKLQDLEAAERRYAEQMAKLVEHCNALEDAVEALKVRLKAVERATPLKRPRKPPPQRPVR